MFGVDFFSVINRGSQYKVESFMFRIGKPESLVFLSPSKDDVCPFSDLGNPNNNTAIIGWETKRSGVHAIDYGATFCFLQQSAARSGFSVTVSFHHDCL